MRINPKTHEFTLEIIMSVYRMTKFTSSDFDKALKSMGELRDIVAGADAECIDVVSLGNGNGVVIAK